MNSPRWPLLQASYAALGTIVVDGVTVGVFDHVMPHNELPYVIIGNVNLSRWGSHTNPGVEALHEVNIWSLYAGTKELARIEDVVIERLARELDLTDSGFVVTYADLESSISDRLELEMGVVRHSVLRFRYLIYEL